jgi:cyclic beta-1,2-glucan synthetase
MIIGRITVGSSPPSLWSDRGIIREELFSTERLEEHARSLAAAQTIASKRVRGHPLADRLLDNSRILLAANRTLITAVDAGYGITPAAEWLIDNYHVVESQIRQIQADLPPGFYSELPKLADGPLAGLPRVFGVAWAFIAHTDSRFEPGMLRSYLRAYQEIQPLTIGELWAVAITLRIVLVENLRRVAELIVDSRTARQDADKLADRLLRRGGSATPEPDELTGQPLAPLSEPFAVQLLHRLRGQEPDTNLALTWIDDRLAAQNTTADAVVRNELQRQGARNVTTRNIITSMRHISGIDWTEVFESVCLVDEVLATNDSFRDMDFPTRNSYRSAIEELARGSEYTEIEIAQRAVACAKREKSARSDRIERRRCDPGYYLVGGGRAVLEAGITFRPALHARLVQWNRRLGIVGYGSFVVVLAAAFVAIPLVMLAELGMGKGWLVTLGLLGVVPASDAAVANVNRLATWVFGPTLLPGFELRDGIPPHLRTLVVVPTFLTSLKSIAEQIARLEVHHLASKDGELHFALLSDWVDSATENRDDDENLLASAIQGISELNRRYGPAPGGDRFLLLHRRRRWNEGEGQWIGWERKRGKLHELNRLLRGAIDTTFVGLPPKSDNLLNSFRYVVTLDADTMLPRDTIRRLVGKMAHPLNEPHLDPKLGRVVDGYAVLQPRVTPSLPVGRDSSLFQRVFSSMDGIDPYAAAISDVYQDLFGEGTYSGKGIYEIDAFEAALAGRVQDSTLLSHDLFEGVFARAGLASDVEVVEEFPARYNLSALRQHRWARGDWQLLPLIVWRGARIAKAARLREDIPAIGRWKMLDNLRRTLSAPAAVLALLIGWRLPFPAALIWTLFIVATIGLPALLPVGPALVPRRHTTTLRSYTGVIISALQHALTLSGLIVILLAHQACLMIDAIVRTLVRLILTHRHLLEWVPAAQVAKGPELGLVGSYRRMAGAPIIGAVTLVAALLAEPQVWLLAVPFAILWIASPAVAWWASLCSLTSRRLAVSDPDALALRLIARRTWRFFETFVTSADHMLPPDNFQEDPQPTVARRTSPTNMGLYLLSVVSARDFGWMGSTETVERLESTLTTMTSLARFKGHFFNWYDTSDLHPLEPKYVSTVDSGNLAGHLIAVANACRVWCDVLASTRPNLAGVLDALGLARDAASHLSTANQSQHPTELRLDDALIALGNAIESALTDDQAVEQMLDGLYATATTAADLARVIATERNEELSADVLFWVEAARRSLESHLRDLHRAGATNDDLSGRLSTLEGAARTMALAMDFGFLHNHDRKMLSIGYLVLEDTLDANCYDLLASEARLASFVAIAKCDLPAREWFRLGRAVTAVASGGALISWSGSMFEYLMPSLVMRSPVGSLIEQTNRLIVARQIEYGARLGIPWGISEAAYNARDLEYTYQYSNFGVPSLGYKRGLEADAVVAPYATALATMVAPQQALRNFNRLAESGGQGRYGFYESLDFTPARVPAGKSVAVVRAFMAHHQGMSIVAIGNALHEGAMRRRFHAEPMVRATELLLQEHAARNVAVVRPWAAATKPISTIHEIASPSGRRFTTAHTAFPATHLLSNGRYTVMLTAAGSGYSRWGEIAVTRWREDSTCDDWGSYIFLKDIQNDQMWSVGIQPTGIEPDEYAVAFEEDRAEFARRDGTLTTTLEVIVSAEDNAEVRRVSVSNAGDRIREIEVTSYAELALTQPAADIAHPAFSKLFVETQYLPDAKAVLATRRLRAPTDPAIWAAHLVVTDGTPEVETDRANFLGRGPGVRSPIAVTSGQPLTNTVGTVLDPVFALRCRVSIAPGAIVHLAFWTVVASSRGALIDLIDRHRDVTAFDRASTLAWTQAQVQLRHLGIDPSEADLFQRLAGHLLYAGPELRPSSATITRGAGRQSGLWGLGISGDLPILLLRIADPMDINIVRQLLRAFEYLQMKRLALDLVILNEQASSYVQDLQVALEGLLRASQTRAKVAKAPRGAVFLVRADLVSMEARTLLAAVARVVLVGQRGRLSEQLDRAQRADAAAPPRSKSSPVGPQPASAVTLTDLEFFNGLGGFAKEGREYITILGPGQSTPAPWINVVANPAFGFQVAAEGSGYTWSGNSRERQLTPWSNDPITDHTGEVFYLRDEDTGELWGPTAVPVRVSAGTYVARHGWGYSQFTHTANEIASNLTQYVPIDGPIKISRLQLSNTSSRTRHISATAYVEWVLGPSRSASALFVATEIDPTTGAMFARNLWDATFGTRVAFADFRGQQTDWTGDRREFIGRNGTLDRPQSIVGAGPFSRNVGAGLDPCGALRTTIELQPFGHGELVFFLGEAASAEEAQVLLAHFRGADLDTVLADVQSYWEDLLGAVQVKTPDRTIDIMLNGWLLYQTLACRTWARSAFYQASGAFGFRDQLQDGMALAVRRPAIVREHLLRAASRQFLEGDVQHWWLPHSGAGVRTRISDDRVWLAYCVAHYVDVTGEVGILDAAIPFLEGQRLAPDEAEGFFVPTISDTTGTLFEHCARALDHSLAVGRHGLPLMGTGDWNDGMNRVGEGGEGESIWLGWFFHATLSAFIPLAEARGEAARGDIWRAHANALKISLEREAWDGDWYRRAYFDDGTPLGAKTNDECRIDSISQSWAVISGAARLDRSRRAMTALEQRLIRPLDGLALLFAPPFDKTVLDPGYIKGYPPGIRENGGQYTHAALWTVMAFAILGQGDAATALFSLLNPINHTLSAKHVRRYKVEPYVVAADIYAIQPHVGRGGWTWYTGSAGWMQRAGVESILGLRIRADVLYLDPCVPKDWPQFEIVFRHHSARYIILVDNPRQAGHGITSITLDGTMLPGSIARLPLMDDGTTHRIELTLG